MENGSNNGDNSVFLSSSPAAKIGLFPTITLPMGILNGLPVGINFLVKHGVKPEL